jgi:monoamine oxidase
LKDHIDVTFMVNSDAIRSTGLFDQAFMETICDYYDFDEAKEWYRLENTDSMSGQPTKGMQALTDAMVVYLASKGVNVTLKSPVLKMVDKKGSIEVTYANANGGPDITKTYESVYNTTTMGCLERMDIQGLNLQSEVLTGIRALSYDRATKVCIKFNSAWWSMLGTKDNPFVGGVSSSDLPISNVVYPSWNDAGSNILMISYAWAQDATRIQSLIKDYNGQTQLNKDDSLVVLCLKNLAELWASVPNAPTYDDLRTMYQSHHAWAWENYQWTAGAFALFGPGQFQNIYPAMQQPQCQTTGSKAGFYMCGEATSAHHAWISGALDSAYMSVWQWAGIQGGESVQDALKTLGFGGGENAHPAEMDEKLLNWSIWAGLHGKKHEKGQ